MRTFLLMSVVLTGVVVSASKSILFDAPERFAHEVSQMSAQMTHDVPVDDHHEHLAVYVRTWFDSLKSGHARDKCAFSLSVDKIRHAAIRGLQGFRYILIEIDVSSFDPKSCEIPAGGAGPACAILVKSPILPSAKSTAADSSNDFTITYSNCALIQKYIE